MSKLTDLINELCPDGVEYKPLGDIATISRGGSLQKKDFCDEGIPCIHYGQIYTKFGLFTDKALTYIKEDVAKRQKMAAPNDIVMAVTSENIEDVCKCVVWLGDEDAAVSGHTAIIHHNQNSKYLAYYFHSAMFYKQKAKLAHGTKVIEVTPDKLNSVKVPVPPLEVQREIVRVLDSFTLLTAELTAELTARKKQYDYYKDTILSSTKGETVQLGDVLLSLHTGLNPRKFFKLNTEDATNYYVTIREFKGGYLHFDDKTDMMNDEALKLCNNRSNLEKGDLLFSGTGTIGETMIVEDEPDNWNIKEGVYALKPDNSRVSVRFLKHVLSSKMMMDTYATLSEGGTVKSISMKKMNSLKIVLPTMCEQQQIATLLDRFDKLCNDISDGIPAEIETRQKQYEYYRDKLLSFREMGA